MPSIIIKISGTPPTANPDPALVSPGDDIEVQSDDAFTLKFTDDTPDEDNPDKKRKSKKNGKEKVKMKAKKNSTGQDVTYPYEIIVGNTSVDPSIIIKAS